MEANKTFEQPQEPLTMEDFARNKEAHPIQFLVRSILRKTITHGMSVNQAVESMALVLDSTVQTYVRRLAKEVYANKRTIASILE